MLCPLLMLAPLPRSTLFPYTTLFRSLLRARVAGHPVAGRLGSLPFRHRGDRGPRPLGGVRGPHLLLRSEEHTSELQSRGHLVCRLLLEKKKKSSLVAGLDQS